MKNQYNHTPRKPIKFIISEHPNGGFTIIEARGCSDADVGAYGTANHLIASLAQILGCDLAAIASQLDD